LNILTVGFKQLFNTLKDISKYKGALYFFIAYLLYNDGVQTVKIIAAEFGKEELGIELSTLTQIILVVQFVGFFGSFIFNYLAKKTGAKNAILLNILIWSLSLIYSYFFLEGVVGFWGLSIVIGLILGGIQALSRSLFSNLIPLGKQSEYFAFFEISNRGSSLIGPLLFGLSLQLSGSYRFAILSLIIFFIAGALFLMSNKIAGKKIIS